MLPNQRTPPVYSKPANSFTNVMCKLCKYGVRCKRYILGSTFPESFFEASMCNKPCLIRSIHSANRTLYQVRQLKNSIPICCAISITISFSLPLTATLSEHYSNYATAIGNLLLVFFCTRICHASNAFSSQWKTYSAVQGWPVIKQRKQHSVVHNGK